MRMLHCSKKKKIIPRCGKIDKRILLKMMTRLSH